MKRQVFLCNDLGGGDGGKGGVVHKICREKQTHTVLKWGGAQGSHGVRTSRGESFNFSQLGCGTFEGAKTHITPYMLVEPVGLLMEANSLMYEHGVRNIFDLLTLDERALCITPFHASASRLRELARKDNPKGTVGIGGGDTVLDAERDPDFAIRISDLGKPDLIGKLEHIRDHKRRELSSIIDRVSDLWPEDQPLAHEEIRRLNDDVFLRSIAERFKYLSVMAKIVDGEYLAKEILSQDGTVVVESSHGILTDRYHGFHPHTTKLRTLPQCTIKFLQECGYDGEVVRLGISRAYQIRHGAGPMVTEDPTLIPKLLPDSNKHDNRWQGVARVGPLDLVALRYAIEVCGGPEAFDGLAITWFDQIPIFGKWDTCNRYIGADDPTFFSPEGGILVRRGSDQEQLDYQEKLGRKLRECRPEITSYDLPTDGGQEGMIDLCTNVLKERLGVSVRMMSFGPTDEDKACL